MRPRLLSSSIVLLLAAPASSSPIEWVLVGDPGNASRSTRYCVSSGVCEQVDRGAVSYSYYITKHEITNEQYVEFLNAVAATDTDPTSVSAYHLYTSAMETTGISRTGSPGNYSFSVQSGWEDRPAVYVRFPSVTRFANWLNNGKPVGPPSITNEGSYTLESGTQFATRNPGASIVLPTYDEWFKAAYYDPLTSAYLDFPTGSSTAPTCGGPSSTSNHANCESLRTVDVGSYPNTASPWGVLDMAGNVRELTEERTQRLVEIDDFEFELLWGSTHLGGYFGSFASYFDIDGSAGFGWSTGVASSMGFRLVMLVPEPGTALLVGLGLAGLARSGRGRS